MVNNSPIEKEKIKLRIEQLKDEKENLKFGYDKSSNYFIALIIFIASGAITAAQFSEDSSYKIIIYLVFLALIFISWLVLRLPMSKRLNSMEDKAKEIKDLYEKLISSA